MDGHCLNQWSTCKKWLTKEKAFFISTKIYNPYYLKNPKGNYKGYSFRSQITGNSLKSC